MTMWTLTRCTAVLGAGSGLAAVVFLVTIAGKVPVAGAADLGSDRYGADVYGVPDDTYAFDRHGRQSLGRHPQTPYGSRFDHDPSYDPDDRTAFRDHAPDADFDDQPYSQAPYAGSLKDGGVTADGFEEIPSKAYRDHDLRQSSQCLSERAIRRQLRRAGWRGFRRGRVRGNIGYVHARKRRSGEIYELAVDRCTGELISAACIDRGDRRYRDDVAYRW